MTGERSRWQSIRQIREGIREDRFYPDRLQETILEISDLPIQIPGVSDVLSSLGETCRYFCTDRLVPAERYKGVYLTVVDISIATQKVEFYLQPINR